MPDRNPDEYYFKLEMEQIHRIKDAAMDLYEACLAMKKEFSGYDLTNKQLFAFELLDKALDKAEAK